MNNDFINALQNILLDSSNNEFNFLYDNMSSYQKEIFNNMKSDIEFLKNYTLSDLIFDFDSRFIESILSLELDLYLNECKKSNIDNNITIGIVSNLFQDYICEYATNFFGTPCHSLRIDESLLESMDNFTYDMATLIGLSLEVDQSSFEVIEKEMM